MPTVPFAPTVDVATGGMVPLGAPDVKPFQSTADLVPTEVGKAELSIATGIMSAKARQELEAQRTQDIADEAAVSHADNQLSQAVITQMYGKDGFMGKKGLNASESAWSATNASLQTEQDRIQKTLTTENGRNLFARHSEARWIAIQQAGSTHLSTEIREAHLSEGTANAEKNFQLASLDYLHWDNSGSTYFIDKSVAVTGLRKVLADSGMVSDKIDMEVLKATTKFHDTVIESYLSQGTHAGNVEAKRYFEHFKDEMTRDAQNLESGKIKKNLLVTETQDLAFEAVAGAAKPGADGMPVDEAGQLEHLTGLYISKQIPWPVYEAAQKQVEHNFKVKDKIEKDQSTKRLMAGYGYTDKGMLVDDFPASFLASLKSGELIKLRDYAEGQYKHGGDDEYFDARVNEAMADPQAFVHRSLAEDRPYLSDAHFRTLEAMKLGIERHDKKTADVLRILKDTKSILESTLRAQGIDSTPKVGSPEAKVWFAFDDALLKTLTDLSEKGQLPKTPDEEKKLGLSLLQPIVTGKHWWGTDITKRRFEAVAVETVPDGAKQAIVAELQQSPNWHLQSQAQKDNEILTRFQRGVLRGDNFAVGPLASPDVQGPWSGKTELSAGGNQSRSKFIERESRQPFPAVTKKAAPTQAVPLSPSVTAPAPVTFEGTIASVMKAEGGSTFVPKDGARGATKFGIYGPVHGLTDEQVASLTEERAIEIYRKDYWDAINADTLPSQMRGIAMDGAVNQGVPTIKRFLALSRNADGTYDKNRFIALRLNRYETTMTNDPYYRSLAPDQQRQYMISWRNRMKPYYDAPAQ